MKKIFSRFFNSAVASSNYTLPSFISAYMVVDVLSVIMAVSDSYLDVLIDKELVFQVAQCLHDRRAQVGIQSEWKHLGRLGSTVYCCSSYCKGGSDDNSKACNERKLFRGRIIHPRSFSTFYQLQARTIRAL